jgi:hypothetical protein
MTIKARLGVLYLAAAGGLSFGQSYSGQFISAGCGAGMITGTATITVSGQTTNSNVDLYSDGVYFGTATASTGWLAKTGTFRSPQSSWTTRSM